MAKRRKHAAKTSTNETENSSSNIIMKRDFLSSIPTELISIIMRDLLPKDILSVARTSRHFCRLLTDPAANHIWRRARKAFIVPVPDPTPNFTESAYAVFVFDGGICENCGEKYNDRSIVIYSLRVRLCINKSGECQRKWIAENLYPWSKVESFLTWRLMSSEGHIPTDKVAGAFQGTRREREYVCWKKEYLQASLDYKKRLAQGPPLGTGSESAAEKQHMLRMGRLRERFIKLCDTLQRWNKRVRSEKIRLRDDSAVLAASKDWDLSLMRSTPTFMKLKRRRNRDWKGLPLGVLESASAGIEADMEKVLGKQARSKQERAYLKKRAVVAAEYSAFVENLKDKSSVIPSLNSYRELPTIKALLKDEQTPEGILHAKLRGMGSETGTSLKADIKLWTEMTTSVFRQRLSSIEYYKEADKSFNLVDGALSWFLCSKCKKHDREKLPIPLNPRDACLHICPHLTAKQKKRYSWSAEQFEIDEKAVKAVHAFLSLIKLSSKVITFATVPLNNIKCKSCELPLILNFYAMVRHYHRHEDMQMAVISESSEEPVRPVEWGLVTKLTAGSDTQSELSELIYGCRHCIPYGLVNEDKEKSGYCKERLMSFHGLRCHLSQRHKIKDIADEDVYRIPAKKVVSIDEGSEESDEELDDRLFGVDGIMFDWDD